MRALISTDRRLGVVDRQLVTDAGGAPCCCGGSGCCALELPCQPYLIVGCVGNVLTPATCPRVTSYRYNISTEFRFDQIRVSKWSRPPTRYGEVPPRITIVRRTQIAFVASYSKCYVPGDTLAAMPGDPVTIEGVQFESVTENGQSAMEYFAGGSVVGTTGAFTTGVSTDAFEVFNYESDIETDRTSPFYGIRKYGPTTVYPFVGQFGDYNYPIHPWRSGSRFEWEPTPGQNPVISNGRIGSACSGRFTSPNSGGYTYSDRCEGGSFDYDLDQRLVNVFDGSQTRNIRITYRTTWTRSTCPCGGGGGTSPQARGGGCAGCGDASSLEVIG